MPPKGSSTSRGGGGGVSSTRGGAARRKSGGGGAARVDNLGEGEGVGDGEEDLEDPVSSLDLAAVVSAFAKSGAKKEKAVAKRLEDQLDQLVESAKENLQSSSAKGFAQYDHDVRALGLSDSTLPSPTPDEYCTLLKTQLETSVSIIGAMDEFVEGKRTACAGFCGRSRGSLSKRTSKHKKKFKKIAKQAQDQADELALMADMNASAGTDFLKGFKTVVRASC
ncbi:hypothetical protein T439DRAFT_322111 [Meredithblackwellia eburnea MCA 4105]